jgi:hypothetical protein
MSIQTKLAAEAHLAEGKYFLEELTLNIKKISEMLGWNSEINH